MPAPSRRTLLQSIGGVLVGSMAYLRVPHWPGFFGGYVEAVPLELNFDFEEHGVPLPPDEFLTPHDDERLDGLEPVQRALAGPDGEVDLSRRTFGTVFDALQELPVFEPHRHEGYERFVFGSGTYVSGPEYTYALRLVPWCSDRWWISTRGTPTGDRTCRHR